jgi:protocatechuate 3,4-dioxygenase beta subunit
VTTESYLRGVQVTDSNGQVTFTTIYPACYSGRWPHIHFEVFLGGLGTSPKAAPPR